MGSRRMLLPWDPTYMTRLWCVFELAAFSFLRQSGISKNIVVLPIAKGGWVWAGIMAVFLHRVYETTHALYMREDPVLRIDAFVVLTPLLIGFGFVEWMRRVSRDLATLPQQLSNFAVANAKCFCCDNRHRHPDTGADIPCDRKLVVSSIIEWFTRRPAQTKRRSSDEELLPKRRTRRSHKPEKRRRLSPKSWFTIRCTSKFCHTCPSV